MKADILFAVLLILGGVLSTKKGFKEKDINGFYSINIRFIGAGLTMLVVAILILAKKF